MRIYDIALSFAGAQRQYAERLANALRKAGVRIFYDQYESDRLWGRDLVSELDRVYRKESRFVVALLSAEYRDKKWTRHEFRSIMAAAIEQRAEYVLPVRFDDTDFEGLSPTVTYMDARTTPPAKLAALVLKKLEWAHEPESGTLEVWRLVSPRFASAPFSPVGAALVGGRWNRQGSPAVYAASSLCVALLETTLHRPSPPLNKLVAVGARIKLSSPPTRGAQSDLPKFWSSAPDSTQTVGTQWLNAGTSVALILPSTVLPAEQIVMLNPTHADFKTLTVFSEEAVNLTET